MDAVLYARAVCCTRKTYWTDEGTNTVRCSTDAVNWTMDPASRRTLMLVFR